MPSMDNDAISPAPPRGPTESGRRDEVRDEFRIDFQDQSRAEGCKFAFSPDHLHKLNDAGNLSALRAFGGLRGVAYGLRTDAKSGLGVDEDVLDGVVTAQDAIDASGTHASPQRLGGESQAPEPGPHGQRAKGHSDRRSTYGESRLPRARERSLLQLAWLAFNDKLIFLLTASNVVSLALGIYAAVSPGNEGDSGARLEWIESVTIAVAIIVIVFGQAINDKVRNRRFVKLNEKKQERSVTVVRSGTAVVISVFDIVVGDLVRLEAGDVVPADGILVDGFAIHCDESPLTGESELVGKLPAPEAERRGAGDCFIRSGTRVEHGVGTYLVTAVGVHSVYGRIKMSLRNDVEETPLQQRLGRLAKQIILTGFVVGALFFTVLFIRWLVELPNFVGSPRDKGESFLDIFMLSVTVVVIGVPEGLSLAVAVALAFATTRMLRDNNLVRLLRSCETMGNATTICSDKTGTLTQNKMSVVAGVVGGRHTAREQSDLTASGNLIASMSEDVKHLLRQSVALNSTAFEKGLPGSSDFVGSSTETALLSFGRTHLAMGPLAEERENSPPVHLFPFNASRKCMATVIKEHDRYRMLLKGASEVALPYCSRALSSPEAGLAAEPFSSNARDGLLSTARGFSDQMLRPIALAYRDFATWPPEEATQGLPQATDADLDTKHIFRDLVFVGIVAIRDPLRPEVVDSVEKCRNAGVMVRMVTGDAFETARAIASECGIYTAGGIALDGPTFRKLSSAQLDLVLPRLQVLARSKPEDKARLVRHLKKVGETVAVTGDGTNDAYALKAADVGFAMGISGTEVAKEASSIILMDDNFSSVVKALAWGRAVNDAAKKFIQFQFTINITAAFLTIVSAIISGVDSSIFAVIQLLWLNLIMDILAAAALATDPPTDDILKRRPEPRSAYIVSPTMWKMILGQATYQLAVIFSLHYAGGHFFTTPDLEDFQHQAFVFNTYIFMQVFNQWNCRRSDNHLNIFVGVLRNPWFLAVQSITLAGQVIIIFKGGDAFQTKPLTGAQWGWCLLFGAMTLPLGAAIRSIPDAFLLKIARRFQPVASLFGRCVGFLFRRKGRKSRVERGADDEPGEFFEDLGDDEERKTRRF